MRRLLLSLVIVALPLGAMGAEWKVELEADEGGDIFTAEILLDEGPELRVICAEGVGRVVFDRGEAAEPKARIGDKSDFAFESETGRVVLSLAYQEVNGSFAGRYERGDGLLNLLQTGTTLTITDTGEKFGQQEFPLTGAAKVVAPLGAQC